MQKIKLVIADDSPFVRDGLRVIFELDEEFEVVGCAENGLQAVELCKNFHADICLMDIQMPLMNGIEATGLINSDTTKVLILTTFDDDDLIIKALKNGAKGYLIKNHPPEKIKQMVKIVYAGGGVLDEVILEKITDNNKMTYMNGAFDQSEFTERELSIIKLISEGCSNKEIADNLFITLGTIKNYISTILDKTELSHRTQIAVYYLTGRKP